MVPCRHHSCHRHQRIREKVGNWNICHYGGEQDQRWKYTEDRVVGKRRRSLESPVLQRIMKSAPNRMFTVGKRHCYKMQFSKKQPPARDAGSIKRVARG